MPKDPGKTTYWLHCLSHESEFSYLIVLSIDGILFLACHIIILILIWFTISTSENSFQMKIKNKFTTNKYGYDQMHIQ